MLKRATLVGTKGTLCLRRILAENLWFSEGNKLSTIGLWKNNRTHLSGQGRGWLERAALAKSMLRDSKRRRSGCASHPSESMIAMALWIFAVKVFRRVDGRFCLRPPSPPRPQTWAWRISFSLSSIRRPFHCATLSVCSRERGLNA